MQALGVVVPAGQVHLRGSFTVKRMSPDGVYRSIGTTQLATPFGTLQHC